MTITIAPRTAVNTAPYASITSPTAGATYTEGDAIVFSGAAEDQEDGALSGQSLTWSVDNQTVGYGAYFQSGPLTVGAHTITLTATDSGGLSHQASVNITVASAQATDMSGEWSYYTSNNWSQTNCPIGQDTKGALTISQSGTSFTLTLSRLTFTGTVRNNTSYTCSNTTQIQGGTQTTTISFQRQSDTSASGSSTTVATYTDSSCQWGSSIYIYR